MWEPEDRNLIDTALRESEEEIALPRRKVEMIAMFDPQVTLYGVKVTPFLGFIPEGLRFLPELTELDAVFQVPLGYLLNASNHTQSRFTTLGNTYDAPCIFYQNYCIWGITYRIMLDVFREVFDFSPGGESEPVAVKGGGT